MERHSPSSQVTFQDSDPIILRYIRIIIHTAAVVHNHKFTFRLPYRRAKKVFLHKLLLRMYTNHTHAFSTTLYACMIKCIMHGGPSGATFFGHYSSTAGSTLVLTTHTHGTQMATHTLTTHTNNCDNTGLLLYLHSIHYCLPIIYNVCAGMYKQYILSHP